MTKKYHMGDSRGGEMGYQCPNCSNIQGSAEKHKYNMVGFKLGEINAKCDNCSAILSRRIV